MTIVSLQHFRDQRAELRQDLADLVALINDMADRAARQALALSQPVMARDPDLARAMNRHCRRRLKGAVRKQTKPLGKAADDFTLYAAEVFNSHLNELHLKNRRCA